MREPALRGVSVGVTAIVLLLGVAAPAFAQGFYYKEIKRDERIYVFNIAAEAERFEKTGEMGRGLTRPGAGPNGETVVGDSERALQLFFFKHGISEVVPEPPAPIQRVEWRDGKTRITTDFAYLEMSNRTQVRYTHEFPDETAAALPGTASPGDSRGSFTLRRVKMKLEGWIWRPPDVAPAPAVLPPSCRASRTSCSSTGRPSPAPTSAPSSRTRTSPGIRRAWGNSGSSRASSRSRSGGSR
jgi:hypothetical protein